MQITKHFKLSEFACNDGTEVPCHLIPRIKELAEQLEVLRKELGGKSIRVTSGYRTKAYNKKVGGAKKSQHVQCRAADIKVKGVTPRRVHLTIMRLIKSGRMKKGGLGLYRSFVHYDTRGFNARWGGR